jgi:O-antigen/teichoic acid export membrane protein
MVVTLSTIPVRLVNKYTRGILIGSEQFKRSNKISWIPNFLNLFSVILFVVIFKWSVLGAILSLLISNIFVGVFAVWLIAKDNKITIGFDFKIIKSLLQLGLVYAIAIFLVKLNFRIDILLLKYLSTTAEVGFYNQGVSVAERWQAPFALGAVILSRSANTENQEAVHNQIARLFIMTIIIGILAASVVYIIAPVFVPFVYGKAFTPSVQIVQFILPAVVLVIMAKILASRLAGLQKTYLVILLYLPALIINIVLNLILIPKYQAMGAVISTNVSYSISFLGIVIIYSKIINRSVFNLFIFRKSDFDFVPALKKMLINKLTGKKPKRKKIKQKRELDDFSFDDSDF